MSSKVISCIYDLLNLQEAGQWRPDGTIVLKRPPASSKLDRIKFRSFSANILPTITNSTTPTIYGELKAHVYGLNEDSSDYVTDALPSEITINTLQGTTTYKVDEGSILLSSFTTTINNTIEESIANALSTSKATLANLLAFKQDDYYRWSKYYQYQFSGGSLDFSNWVGKPLTIHGTLTHDKTSKTSLIYFADDQAVTMRPVELTGFSLDNAAAEYRPVVLLNSLEKVGYVDVTTVGDDKNIMTITSITTSDSSSDSYYRADSTKGRVKAKCSVYDKTTNTITLLGEYETTPAPPMLGLGLYYVYGAQAFPVNALINQPKADCSYLVWLLGNSQTSYSAMDGWKFETMQEMLNNSKLELTSFPLGGFSSDEEVNFTDIILKPMFERIKDSAAGYYYGGFYIRNTTKKGLAAMIKWYSKNKVAFSVIWLPNYATKDYTPAVSTTGFDKVVENIAYDVTTSNMATHRMMMMMDHASAMTSSDLEVHFAVANGYSHVKTIDVLLTTYDQSISISSYSGVLPLSPFEYCSGYLDQSDRTIDISATSGQLGKYKLLNTDGLLLTSCIATLNRASNTANNIAPSFLLKQVPLQPPSMLTPDVYRTYTKEITVGSSSIKTTSLGTLEPLGNPHANYGVQSTLYINTDVFTNSFTFNDDDGSYQTLLLKTSDGKFVLEFYTSIYTDPDVFDFSVDYANSTLYDDNGKPFVKALPWIDIAANTTYSIEGSISNLNPDLLKNLNVYLALRNTDLTLKLVSNDYPTLNNIVFYLNETAMIDFKEASCSPNESVLECRIIDSKGNILLPDDAALLYANIVVAVDWQFY